MDPDSKKIGEVTQVLAELRAGGTDVREQLFQLVYGELRRLAAIQMADQRRGHTLQPTALVHEAYLKLVGGDGVFDDRRHFLNAAARAMRSILVDHARARGRQKRGGGRGRLTFKETAHGTVDAGDEILAVDDALKKLEQIDEQAGRVVALRYFAGLTFEETARTLGITERTAYRVWDRARTWLYRQMAS